MNDSKVVVGKNVVSTWCKAVGEAKESIWIVNYKLTSRTALDALIEAHHRGVQVRLVLDGKAMQHEKSLAIKAQAAGLEIRVWPTRIRGKLHAKLTILDSRQVIFGSFNLTDSAEMENTEVYFSTGDETVVKAFISEWQSLQRLAMTQASTSSNTQ